MNYSAPRWLPGGNLQTIWPALFAKTLGAATPIYKRERWNTPDHDFIDLDWLLPLPPSRPVLVLFHGLEGSSRSHYAKAFAGFAREQNIGFVVPHFRGCSGELNLGPRAYHSGDFEEIHWILQRIHEAIKSPLIAVGVSLGGNALLRWVQESGEQASHILEAAAAVSSPLDLAASGSAMGLGFNKLVYTGMFLRTMKPKAMEKLRQHPGLFNQKALMAARNLYEFDNIFTAPLHGFKDTDDYWARASSKPHLDQLRIPTLVVNALNDPFVPSASLPNQRSVGANVTLWQPRHGGHVGFPGGAFPGDVLALPNKVGKWLLSNVSHFRSA